LVVTFFSVAGIFGLQSASLGTFFSSFWKFRAPISFIGDLFFLVLEFSGSNLLHWGPFFPGAGISGLQSASLATLISCCWNFRTPIGFIGDLFFLVLEFLGRNLLHWRPLFPVSGIFELQPASLVTFSPATKIFGYQ
jgi:hypothetical protein